MKNNLKNKKRDMKKLKFNLENELKDEWREWNNKAHPEDQMSFVDFADEVRSFKDYTVKVERNCWGENKIWFTYNKN